MAKSFTDIRDGVERKLQDSSNAIWDTTELDPEIRDGLRELSELLPLPVRETVYARHNSYEVDVSGITDLISIRHAEWPVDNAIDNTDVAHYRNFKWLNNNRIALDLYSEPQAEVEHDKDGAEDNLTGTVTFSDGSTAITGSGTAFTTELVVGDYIRKSTTTENNWYRVAFIADDTHLTLATPVDADDDGADTADETDYWHPKAYVHCDKVHRLNEMTDLAGTVNNASGYIKNTRTIAIDALQASGTIAENTTLTFANVDGVYTVTADATITTNAATITIEPGISSALVDGEVVTFETSTLPANQERLLEDLVTARVMLNWTGKGRTEIVNAMATVDTMSTTVTGMANQINQAIADSVSARTEMGKTLAAVLLGNAEIDSMTARATQALNKIASGEVEASQITTSLTDANTAIEAIAAQITLQIADIALGRTEVAKAVALISSANSEIALMNQQVDHAVDSLSAGQGYINTTSIGDDPQGDHVRYAQASVQNAQGYYASATGYLTQANTDQNLGNTYANLAMAEFQAAQAKVSEAGANLAKAMQEGGAATTWAGLAAADLAVASMNLNQASGYFNEAQTDIANGNGYLGVARTELQAANTMLSQAAGFAREVTARLNISRALLNDAKKDAQERLGLIQHELKARMIPRSRQMYSRS